ncbi:acyl-CoA N-acyltransferase [Thermodesulfobacteriota bacterium]
MSGVEIVSVEQDAQMDDFIDLPWKIYRDYPNWIPPLKKEVRDLLDSDRHPYWKFSERCLFLARKGSETVGRIAGIVDTRLNEHHKTAMGIWGFFECVNDTEVAAELVAAAEDWVRSKGMTYLIGPLNPSTNYEIGMLTEGFEHRATFMMPFNPPYYPQLMESIGLRKEKDLFSFVVDRSWRMPEWMTHIADRVEEEGRFTIRKADRQDLAAELRRIRQIYDECWAQNWGFVPMTEEEYAVTTKDLDKIADEDLIFFVLDGEEPIACGVIVPDINPLLKRFNGKFGLLGVIKYLLFKKEIDGLRGLIFGVKPGYREMGVPFYLLDYVRKVLISKRQYRYFELGWNLEDNTDMNQLCEQGGAKLFKKYRIYGKSFMDRW